MKSQKFQNNSYMIINKNLLDIFLNLAEEYIGSEIKIQGWAQLFFTISYIKPLHIVCITKKCPITVMHT